MPILAAMNPAPVSTSRVVRAAYGPFLVRVVRTERVGESFLRVTLTGSTLSNFYSGGLDQRVKLAFPTCADSIPAFPLDTDDWYGAWRALPEAVRPVLRTYTVRAHRESAAEVDIDFALHGATGPASRWALAAQPGDELIMVGADARTLVRASEGRLSGIEWDPGAAQRVLLAGDETAVPAICSILEAMPRDCTGQAFLEVPARGDVQPVDAPEGVTVTWLPRESRPGLGHGAALDRAVRAWAIEMVPSAGAEEDLADADAEERVLWDVPNVPDTETHDLYAWIAGEAGAVKSLRRFLVRELGMHRADVAFMGYWRVGAAEN